MSPTVSIVVPAYNAEATLPACLEAIARLTYPVAEVIVFSDGATDGTDQIAKDFGAIVLRNDGKPLGPAKGRNEAAKTATSDLLLFVDADVVVSPDCLRLLVADMQEYGTQAAFGSYDDAPRSQRVTSLYANLRHHYVHQHSAREATTFWSGLGIIERALFLEFGGYDAVRFAHPSVEDVDLGVRLTNSGHRIRLVPEALATHWKDWSLWRVWHTDIVRRAYPWAISIVTGQTQGNDLNLAAAERFKAVMAVLTVLLLFAAFWSPYFLIGAGLTLFIYVGLNAEFFGFLAKRLSPRRAIAAMMMHGCYHLYAPATFMFVLVTHRLGLLRSLVKQ